MKDSPKSDSRVRIVPVIDTMPADLLTPLSVYLKLARGVRGSFLLESVEGGESLARYSFVGADPFMILTGDDGSLRVIRDNKETIHNTATFDFLRDHFARHELVSDETLPPFIGGAIGYMGFETVGWFEPSLRCDRDRNPDAAMMFFDSVIAFDHAKQIVNIVSLVFLDEHSDVSEDEGIHRATEKNRMIRDRLENDPVRIPDKCDGSAGAISSNWTREAFETAVDDIKELIRAGECYQVVLSQRFSRATTADPVSIYRAMRSINPSPYMFLLDLPDRSVIGASPEMLVKCSGRDLQYRPIAGTRRRGKTAVEDQQLADEMRADAKEVAEHLMLVDLGRNDLGRVAEYGTVLVDELMSVEKYSHVQHLVTHLSAKLKSGVDRFGALAACFPAGTVSGAPKIRAIEIIQEIEPDRRDVYAGGVGYFDYGGNLDMCIAIRTLVLKDGVASVQAGAGIVADSVPELEYDETVNKARALLKAIEIAEARSL